MMMKIGNALVNSDHITGAKLDPAAEHPHYKLVVYTVDGRSFGLNDRDADLFWQALVVNAQIISM